MSDESGTVVAVSRNDAYTFTKPNRDEIVLVAGLGVEGDVHAGVNVRHRSRVRADPTQPNLRQVHLIQAELFAEVAEKGFDVPAGGLGENVTTRGLDLLAMSPGTILRFGARDSAERGGISEPGGEASRPGGGEDGPQGGGEDGRPGGGGDGRQGGGEDDGRLGGGEDGRPGGGGHGRAGDGEDGRAALAGVLAAAEAATLDEATARAAAAVAAAAGRDGGDDPRPAIVLAGLRNPCAQIDRFRSGLLKEVLGRDAGGDVVRRAGVMAVVLRGGVIRPGDPVVAEPPPGSPVPLERV
ncbi:MOSC domain-containing protein [Actinoplanes philippinensis]|uniref:MOSC domain-containing protein n=1 Tax=Actinoplanes philippinensis TaxID=35752 RepID=UPI0034070C3B